jgi:putative ribosome biogenesis GTPase RsgA
MDGMGKRYDGHVWTKTQITNISHHRHPIKVGNFRDSRKRIDALIEEHVRRTSQTTHSKKNFKANKDLVIMVMIVINFFRWKHLTSFLIVARS